MEKDHPTTNTMKKIPIGKVTFWKNGKQISSPLSTTKKELLRIGDEELYFRDSMLVKTSKFLTLEEQTRISKETIPLHSNILFLGEVYEKELQEGIIIIHEMTAILFEQQKKDATKTEKKVARLKNRMNLTCLLPEKITEYDYQKMKKYLQNLEETKRGDITIFNMLNEDGTNYQQFLSPNVTKDKMIQIIDLFCRHKLGTLSEIERKIFDTYENFNLEQLLANRCNNNIINHQNCGVIVITPNEMIKRTCTKMSHEAEFQNIDQSFIRNQSLEQANVASLLSLTNFVHIRLLLLHVAEILIELPEIMTSFQKEALLQFLEEVKLLFQFHNMVIVEMSNSEGELYIGIEQCETYLRQIQKNR